MILKKYKKEHGAMACWIMLIGFIMIALPLYPSNKILDYIKLFNTDVNIFHIAYVIILSLIILRKRRIDKVYKVYFFVAGMVLVITMHSFYGIFIGNSRTYILRDLNLFILPLLVFISFSSLFRSIQITLLDLLDYFFYAVLACSTINIIMYLTSNWSFWGLTTYAGNRFGGSYLSNIIFIFWYGILKNTYTNRKNSKFITIYFIVVTVLSIILSQSRALLILAFIGTLIISFQAVFTKNYRVSFKNLFIAMMIIFVMSIGIYFILYGGSDIAARLSSTNIYSQDDSGMVRINIYEQNLKLFLEKPFGAGLGSLFPYYNGYGELLGYSNTIDNAFLTFAEKLGVFGIVLYIYFIVYNPIKYLLGMYKSTKNKLYLFTMTGFVTYLINTAFLTTQTITGIGVSTLLWIFSAYTTVSKKTRRM